MCGTNQSGLTVGSPTHLFYTLDSISRISKLICLEEISGLDDNIRNSLHECFLKDKCDSEKYSSI